MCIRTAQASVRLVLAAMACFVAFGLLSCSRNDRPIKVSIVDHGKTPVFKVSGTGKMFFLHVYGPYPNVPSLSHTPPGEVGQAWSADASFEPGGAADSPPDAMPPIRYGVTPPGFKAPGPGQVTRPLTPGKHYLVTAAASPETKVLSEAFRTARTARVCFEARASDVVEVFCEGPK